MSRHGRGDGLHDVSQNAIDILKAQTGERRAGISAQRARERENWNFCIFCSTSDTFPGTSELK